MIVSFGTLPRPCDFFTTTRMSDLGSDDGDDDGGSTSAERCPRCAVHPTARTYVIPADPYDWPWGEPCPLLPGWCRDDV
ncbi:hypothetical protein psal_cds_325 [Pandoravirus salinus]|uniref:Uncharacterized protein n=1 Tax=Pandoravirus salinus TaxID=1349410 RepID=S4VUD2_9VIRU|nr:hypothetical protein psal_cds_325 [Pandoravirus salinus]AGO83953.1 hypothetical protein psal_cds_325 [Pandoravirus salinus]